MSAPSPSNAGITARSILAALAGMVVCACAVVFFEGVEGSYGEVGSQAMPVPAMLIVLGIIALGAAWWRLFGVRLLSRAELLFVMFLMFCTVPLASSGFWMTMVGAIGSIPKTGDFDSYDALSPALWPHGPNQLPVDFGGNTGTLKDLNLATRGNVTWQATEYEHGQNAVLPVLKNTAPGETSALTLTLPITRRDDAGPAGGAAMRVEEPYLLACLVRAQNLGASAAYACRIYYDDQPYFTSEVFSARNGAENTYLHQTGFLRKGNYGLVIPASVQRQVRLEFSLTGTGEVALADPQLLNVGALDSIYRGRRVIDENVFNASGEPQRTDLLVRPAKLLSRAGLSYLLSSYVPWRDWVRPAFTWCSFTILLLVAIFAFLVLMRRQWLENERFGLPMTHIPAALLDLNGTQARAWPAIFYNQTMWVGFALALVWCGLKGWHEFNKNVPDLDIKVQLTPYFTDSAWGDMWRGREVRNVTFSVTALFLSLSIFMELNVLLSLVVGFFLFRAQYWFGQATGLSLQKNFPYPDQQQVGAFGMYALLILVFSRKHLWRALRAAWRGDRKASAAEPISYRTAFLLLLGCFAGVLAWAHYAQMPLAGIFVFFSFLFGIGIVSARLRAECGTPLSMFAPVALSQLIPVTGGLWLYGPRGAIFVALANWIIFKFMFFLIPGFQLDFLELQRRAHVARAHVRWSSLLGPAVALAIAGCVFLSISYAIGGDNFQQRWPFMDKSFIPNDYNVELAKANMHLGTHMPWLSFDATSWGTLFAAASMTAITLLRQAFTGFWFHPVGFLVSSTSLVEFTWGSILTAWAIRGLTLKLGGAVMIREKLFPFFTGVFLASLASTALFACVNIYLFYYHPSVLRPGLVF